jgi:UDP-N-acetyl-D-mannosaminuronic acid dehydrogenase
LKVAVVGLGYVGVALSVVLAQSGYDVVGIQRRSYRSGWKIDWINKGRSPIRGEEPDLAEFLLQAVKSGKLRAVENPHEINDSEVVIITVQTPIKGDKEPDLIHLIDACREVGKNLSKGSLVCIESTVPPGTTEFVVKPIIEESELKLGIDFNLVFSYERVTPGHLIENLCTLPRVIGGITTDCAMRGKEFYETFCRGEIFITDSRTAETSKLVENSHRDVNIAFANEASLICKALGVDFYEVKEYVNALPNREGAGNPYRNILEPGAGVGGHCLPKDSHLLLHSFQKTKDGFKPQLIPMGRMINESMPGYMYDLINEALDEAGNKIPESKIGILGLSYKEDTGDPRNSPTIKLIELLDIPVRVHDPYIADHLLVKPQPLVDTILGADCLVVMTRHSQYRELELDCIASMMRTRVIVDGRNLFDPEECVSNGFIYRGIGHITR